MSGSGAISGLRIRDSVCSACGTCGLFCPNDALKVEEDESIWRIRYSAARCTCCGTCLGLCDVDALSPAPSTLDGLLGEAVTLLELPRRSCDECGVASPDPSADAEPGRRFLCRSCRLREQRTAAGNLLPG